MSKLESDFQANLIKDLKKMLPGCFILKNDANLVQGIPDLLVLYKSTWAMLEVKASADASHQPNQDYYIDMFGEMSYSAFIFPENKEEILREIYAALWGARASRPALRV
jgi:hypothetical protein